MDQIKRIDGVNIDDSDSRYGIFYPYDGLLQGDYASLFDAQESLAHLKNIRSPNADLLVDAYMVRINIERVEVF